MNARKKKKRALRRQICELRPDFQTLEKLSEVIVETFQGLELFQNAKTIGAYMPLPDEVDLSPLFGCGSAGLSAKALAKEEGVALPHHTSPKGGANRPGEPSKQFYIPAFDESSGLYRLAELTSELREGKYGIPEPATPVFAPETLDLIIVPGVAFDRAGHRIGRGGGFYDRLLPQYQAVRAGICFDFQRLESIPAEKHDCSVDLLVTESEFLNLR